MNYGENEISTALCKLGHTVKILTGDRYFPFPNYDDTAGKILGSRQRQTGISHQGSLLIVRKRVLFEFAARAFFLGVREQIHAFDPDIIIVSGTSTPTAVQAALFKPSSTRLIYVDSHLPSELNQGNTFLKSFFYFAFRHLFAPLIAQKANKIIAAQEATATVISKTYGISTKPVVISHGTNVDLFTPSPKLRSAYRKKMKISAADFVVITTGKIIPAKGVHLLTEAMAPLLVRHPDVHLVVVGDGPDEYKQRCVRAIPAVLRKRIHLEGFQSQKNLPAYYACADLAVWPLQESLAMNDAMSCELPVIANDKVGVHERFSNKNGLFYRQGDVLDLTAKIEYVYQNVDRRLEMGKRGRKLAQTKMSWLSKAAEYIA